MNNRTSIACYAVFHNNKQLRVFHAGETVKHSKVAYGKSVALANANHDAGYPCEVEEFNMYCRNVGRTVYRTSKG